MAHVIACFIPISAETKPILFISPCQSQYYLTKCETAQYQFICSVTNKQTNKQTKKTQTNKQKKTMKKYQFLLSECYLAKYEIHGTGESAQYQLSWENNLMQGKTTKFVKTSREKPRTE